MPGPVSANQTYDTCILPKTISDTADTPGGKPGMPCWKLTKPLLIYSGGRFRSRCGAWTRPIPSFPTPPLLSRAGRRESEVVLFITRKSAGWNFHKHISDEEFIGTANGTIILVASEGKNIRMDGFLKQSRFFQTLSAWADALPPSTPWNSGLELEGRPPGDGGTRLLFYAFDPGITRSTQRVRRLHQPSETDKWRDIGGVRVSKITYSSGKTALRNLTINVPKKQLMMNAETRGLTATPAFGSSGCGKTFPVIEGDRLDISCFRRKGWRLARKDLEKLPWKSINPTARGKELRARCACLWSAFTHSFYLEPNAWANRIGPG
ncbi:hypothetical protein FQR65_LT20515 [Abscondita terminalis]|nr:hypothetical protein FQR65_LT20515 [Abscondita terminalis]